MPTLSAPIPEGKSVVWCVSFQLAWGRLRDDVAKGPVRLATGQPLADRLNSAEQSEEDVQPDDVFAAAGLAKENIVEQIQGRMAAKFPNVPAPQLDVPPAGAIAYAYLAVSITFENPFFENDEPFMFTDSSGKETAIATFGIRKKDDYAYGKLRRQVEVLYRSRESADGGPKVAEFILDPCMTSRPYQIVLARVHRKPTLVETLADIERKIAAKPTPIPFEWRLSPRDVLLIPTMTWKISHRFNELEGVGKQFLNPALRGLHLDTAMQTIQFRLDRGGAELKSEAKVYMKPAASYYLVDRPFLMYMKKRGGKHPFFVAWIDNAELLQNK